MLSTPAKPAKTHRHDGVRSNVRSDPRSDARCDLERRFAAGDQNALGSLMASDGSRLRSHAQHLLRDPRLSEEALAIGMYKAWSKRHTYDPTRPIGPWLHGIVRRSAIDILRHERNRPQPVIGTAPDRLDPTVPTIDRMIMISEVRDAIETLPDNEREVVVLQDLLGFRQSDIAERLGVPIGTIKSRGSRARRRLRDQLSHLRTN